METKKVIKVQFTDEERKTINNFKALMEELDEIIPEEYKITSEDGWNIATYVKDVISTFNLLNTISGVTEVYFEEV